MFERILLAIDETPSADVAVSFVSALAAGTGTTVHVVHANVVMVGGRGATLETHEQASRVVAGAVEQLRVAGVDASGEGMAATVLDIAPRLARIAERVGADVIVLGSRRRRRLARMAGGGIRERVTRATALPVITAPSPLKVGRGGRPAAEMDRLARTIAPAESNR